MRIFIRNLTHLIAAIAFWYVLFICFDHVFAQRQVSQSQKNCVQSVTGGYWLQELAKIENKEVDLKDGFKATRNCNTVVVSMPGAYLDTLNASRAHPLSFQLAATAFVKACNTSAKNIDEAMSNHYITSEDVRQGSGDITTEYLFKAKNDKPVRIFVYLNDYSGILGVIKVSQAEIKKRT